MQDIQGIREQQIVTAAADGGIVSFTIGQVVYTAINVSNVAFSQGVQRAYTSESFTLIEPVIVKVISMLPNLVIYQLNRRVNDFNNHKLSYQIFDLQYKLLRKESITPQETALHMTYLTIATYLI